MELSKEEKIFFINETIKGIRLKSIYNLKATICGIFQDAYEKEKETALDPFDNNWIDIFPELFNALNMIAHKQGKRFLTSYLWDPKDYQIRINFLNGIKDSLQK